MRDMPQETVDALRKEMLDLRARAKAIQIKLDNRYGRLHCETIKYGFPQGIEDLEIHFGYNPAERETRDEPGCPESFDIVAIYLESQDGWQDIYPAMSELDILEIEQLLSDIRGDDT